MSSSISTRTGDDGTSSLLFGRRAPKHHPQFEAIGACDEWTASLGSARAGDSDPDRRKIVESLQHDLIALMGELACAPEDRERYEKSKLVKLDAEALQRIEQSAAGLEKKLGGFTGWAIPGATPVAAAYDRARADGRRAERRISALGDTGYTVRDLVRQYVNRASDLLWLLARDTEDGAARRNDEIRMTNDE